MEEPDRETVIDVVGDRLWVIETVLVAGGDVAWGVGVMDRVNGHVVAIGEGLIVCDRVSVRVVVGEIDLVKGQEVA